MGTGWAGRANRDQDREQLCWWLGTAGKGQTEDAAQGLPRRLSKPSWRGAFTWPVLTGRRTGRCVLCPGCSPRALHERNKTGFRTESAAEPEGPALCWSWGSACPAGFRLQQVSLGRQKGRPDGDTQHNRRAGQDGSEERPGKGREEACRGEPGWVALGGQAERGEGGTWGCQRFLEPARRRSGRSELLEKDPGLDRQRWENQKRRQPWQTGPTQLTPKGSDPSRGQEGTGGCRHGLASPAQATIEPTSVGQQSGSHTTRSPGRDTRRFLTLACPPHLFPSPRWGKLRLGIQRAGWGLAAREPGRCRPHRSWEGDRGRHSQISFTFRELFSGCKMRELETTDGQTGQG